MVLTLSEIQFAVGQWSAVQFPANTPLEPLEGMVEELGELAHARLKRRQGIRHTPEECVAMERDAIGDMGIYLCDFASRTGIVLAAELERQGRRFAGWRSNPVSDVRAFGLLSLDAAVLLSDFADDVEYEEAGAKAGDVLGALIYYAERRGWDFLGILNETWAGVSKRDWRADPMKAGGHS
jgi:NTP pyrophosphatase (non-canonical NTP hydrolase)